MKISALVKSRFNQHEIKVQTNNDKKPVSISPKANGYGSSINGGELLLLALATCFCNDIYREANKRNLTVTNVEVLAEGEFGAEGEPGTDFKYKAIIESDAPAEAINEMIAYVDKIAEVHNTLRKGLSITLGL